MKTNSKNQTTPSFADISVFHVIVGLQYAFPVCMKLACEKTPLLLAWFEKVKNRKNIAAYLSSSRRKPFSSHEVFRYYAELDNPNLPKVVPNPRPQAQENH